MQTLPYGPTPWSAFAHAFAVSWPPFGPGYYERIAEFEAHVRSRVCEVQWLPDEYDELLSYVEIYNLRGVRFSVISATRYYLGNPELDSQMLMPVLLRAHQVATELNFEFGRRFMGLPREVRIYLLQISTATSEAKFKRSHVKCEFCNKWEPRRWQSTFECELCCRNFCLSCGGKRGEGCRPCEVDYNHRLVLCDDCTTTCSYCDIRGCCKPDPSVMAKKRLTIRDPWRHCLQHVTCPIGHGVEVTCTSCRQCRNCNVEVGGCTTCLQCDDCAYVFCDACSHNHGCGAASE